MRTDVQQLEAATRRLTSDLAGKIRVPRQKVEQIFTMDQLMSHLETVAPGEWRLHGSAALHARGIPGTRVPKDLDLYCVTAKTPDEAVEKLAAAVEAVAPDSLLQFDILRTKVNNLGGKALVGVTGNGVKQEIGIDVRPISPHLSKTSEVVGPMLDVSSLGIQPPTYATVPLDEQVAEKISGMLIVHPDLLPDGLSTRYKDVVDLVVLARNASVDCATIAESLHAGAADLGRPSPAAYVAPSAEAGKSDASRQQWVNGVNKAFEKAGMNVTCEEAEMELQAFIGPLLDGTAKGLWNPAERGWDASLQPVIQLGLGQTQQLAQGGRSGIDL